MSKDTQIGDMIIDGLSIDQLEVIIRLAVNAEIEYDIVGRTEMANQCMNLRNRATRLRKQMLLYPE